MRRHGCMRRKGRPATARQTYAADLSGAQDSRHTRQSKGSIRHAPEKDDASCEVESAGRETVWWVAPKLAQRRRLFTVSVMDMLPGTRAE